MVIFLRLTYRKGNMIIPTTRMTPPLADDPLQPLREVGTMEKTQFWDMEDVMEALRIANFRGIPISRLSGNPPLWNDFSRACS